MPITAYFSGSTKPELEGLMTFPCNTQANCVGRNRNIIVTLDIDIPDCRVKPEMGFEQAVC